MERSVRILMAIGFAACLPTHAFALYLLWSRLEIANGTVSALLLVFGMSAAKAFYIVRCSPKGAGFASVPKLKLTPRAQIALAIASLLIVALAACLTLKNILPTGSGKIPLGAISLLTALFYLSLLIGAFSENAASRGPRSA